MCTPRLYLLLFFFVLPLAPVHAGSGGAVSADTTEPATYETLDQQLLARVYHTEAPALRLTMRAADASAFPVFFGAPIAAWTGVWFLREEHDFSDAYRLTLTEVLTYGTVVGAKRLVNRPRPYAVLPSIVSRSPHHDVEREVFDPYSFPSGHAALAFALATSWSLSHPQWYVVSPSMVWASSVALSRVWLGVHYPSDVLAGAALGAAVATGVHLLGAAITPDLFKPEEEGGVPVLHLRISL